MEQKEICTEDILFSGTVDDALESYLSYFKVSDIPESEALFWKILKIHVKQRNMKFSLARAQRDFNYLEKIISKLCPYTMVPEIEQAGIIKENGIRGIAIQRQYDGSTHCGYSALSIGEVIYKLEKDYSKPWYPALSKITSLVFYTLVRADAARTWKDWLYHSFGPERIDDKETEKYIQAIEMEHVVMSNAEKWSRKQFHRYHSVELEALPWKKWPKKVQIIYSAWKIYMKYKYSLISSMESVADTMYEGFITPYDIICCPNGYIYERLIEPGNQSAWENGEIFEPSAYDVLFEDGSTAIIDPSIPAQSLTYLIDTLNNYGTKKNINLRQLAKFFGTPQKRVTPGLVDSLV